MKLTSLVALLTLSWTSAIAGMDNPVAAAQEATSGKGIPATAVVLGALGAAWLGYSGREHGQALLGAAIGFALGSVIGMVLHLFI